MASVLGRDHTIYNENPFIMMIEYMNRQQIPVIFQSVVSSFYKNR